MNYLILKTYNIQISNSEVKTMELALGIPDFYTLNLLSQEWDELFLQYSYVRNSLENIAEVNKVSRVYFGQEFCERALPDPEQLSHAFKVCRNKGVSFSLATPYLTEQGLDKLDILLKKLVKNNPRSEVIVNDWGVLHLIRHKYPSLKPVLGRLLNKILRDPRIIRHVPQSAFVNYQSSSIGTHQFGELLRNARISRIELDNTIQGLDNNLPNLGFDLSLCIPYGLITTGRSCLMGSWGLAKNEKFSASRKSCSHNCKDYWLDLYDRTWNFRRHKEFRIRQKGNTVFYLQHNKFIKEGLNKAKDLGFDRIIYQPLPV